jgi:hypothetical protein
MEWHPPRDFLTFFGITETHTDQGQSRWSVKVCADGTESKIACFDRERRMWMLESSTNGHHTEEQPLLDPRAHDGTNITNAAKSSHSSDHPELSSKQRLPAEATIPDIGQQENVRPVTEVGTTKNNHTCLLDTADWIRGLPSTDHVDFFRNKNWAATPLGHCSTWPHCLRLYMHMVFSDTRVSGIYWGPKRIALYSKCTHTIQTPFVWHMLIA